MNIKRKNNLWDLILTESFDLDSIALDSFREINGQNDRFTSWSAIEPSSRYFKSLLYAHAENLDRRILQSKLSLNLESKDKRNGNGIKYYLKKIRNQNFGNPTSINYFNNDINIDYLLSIEEMFFLHKELKESKTILEIGAGFGRLAHSIVENFENVERYIIIDLDPCLNLAKSYLSKVLNKEDFLKVKFISSNDFDTLDSIKTRGFDISININSFQEMEESIVLDYLGLISENSNYFYTKNAICKYHPDSIDVKLKNKIQFESALNMGLCKDIIDIFDSNAIQEARDIYLRKYCPRNFKISKQEPCFGQYLYYYSALYKRI